MENKALVKMKEQAITHNKKIWYIAKSPHDIDGILSHLGMKEYRKQFEYVSSPDKMRGLRHPNVLILPNWWMNGRYKNMEQALIDVQANIVKI